MSKKTASVLDNTDKIRTIDKSDMLAFCVDAAVHYREAAKIAEKISLQYSKVKNVIVAGMGGSAIGGELLKDWARNKAQVPIEVNRDYVLPAYANEFSLVLVMSNSGETEESLSALLDSARKGCMIYCIASGGSLIEFAEKLGLPYLRVPSDIPALREECPERQTLPPPPLHLSDNRFCGLMMLMKHPAHDPCNQQGRLSRDSSERMEADRWTSRRL